MARHLSVAHRESDDPRQGLLFGRWATRIRGRARSAGQVGFLVFLDLAHHSAKEGRHVMW